MQLLLKLLQLTQIVSPELKAQIRQSLDALEASAKKTKLPVDDIAVGILKTLCTLIGLY